MAENSKIQWTDHTFNPWRGCTKVAAGCANCYAETLSNRNPGTLGIWGPNGTRVLASEAMWREPAKWNRFAESMSVDVEPYRPRVFCASLADLFEDYSGDFPDDPPGVHGGVKCLVNAKGRRLCTRVGIEVREQWPDEPGWRPYTMVDARDRLFRLWRSTLNLDWLVLTKRIENARRMLDGRHENLWLGTSIANQEDADRNIPELLKCRDLAAKLFLSIEPLVGPVMLHPWIDESGAFHHSFGVDADWVIVGGESGPNARPCNVEWVRSIVQQCQAAGVPCFVKQLGTLCIDDDSDCDCGTPTNGWLPSTRGVTCTEGLKIRLLDPKGGDPSEWPEDLRVREVPHA